MTLPLTWSAVAAGAVLLLNAVTPADRPAAFPSHPAAITADSGDQAIAQALLDANAHEIQAARAYVNKAQDADVRAYAQRLDDEHSRMLEKLTPIAKKLGATPSADMAAQAASDSNTKDGMAAGAMADSTGKPMVNPDMAETSADDKAFVDAMVTGHEELKGTLKQESGRIRDGGLKKYVRELQMSVDAHLTRAKQLQAQLGKAPATKPAEP